MERLTALKDLVTSLEIDFSRAKRELHADLWDQVAESLEQIMVVCLEMARFEVLSLEKKPDYRKTSPRIDEAGLDKV